MVVEGVEWERKRVAGVSERSRLNVETCQMLIVDRFCQSN